MNERERERVRDEREREWVKEIQTARGLFVWKRGGGGGGGGGARYGNRC